MGKKRHTIQITDRFKMSVIYVQCSFSKLNTPPQIKNVLKKRANIKRIPPPLHLKAVGG